MLRLILLGISLSVSTVSRFVFNSELELLQSANYLSRSYEINYILSLYYFCFEVNNEGEWERPTLIPFPFPYLAYKKKKIMKEKASSLSPFSLSCL